MAKQSKPTKVPPDFTHVPVYRHTYRKIADTRVRRDGVPAARIVDAAIDLYRRKLGFTKFDKQIASGQEAQTSAKETRSLAPCGG